MNRVRTVGRCRTGKERYRDRVAALLALAGHAAYALLGISVGAATTWSSLHYWPGPDVPLWVTGVASLLLSVAAVTVLSGIHARLTRPRPRLPRSGRRAHARPRAVRKAP